MEFMYSGFANISFSIDNKINPLNISYNIVNCRYDFY